MSQDSSPVGRRIRLSYKTTYDSLFITENLTIFSLKKKIETQLGLENTPFYSCYLAGNELIVIDTPSRLKEFVGLVSCTEIEVLLKEEADSDQSLREKLNRTIPFETKSRNNISIGAGIPKSRESGPSKDITSKNVAPRFSSQGPAIKTQTNEDAPRNPVDNWLDNTVIPPWDEVRGLKNPVFGNSSTLNSTPDISKSSDTIQAPPKVKIKLSDIEAHKYGDERSHGFKPAFDEKKVVPKQDPKEPTAVDLLASTEGRVDAATKVFEANDYLPKDFEAKSDIPNGIEVKAEIPEVFEVKADVPKGLKPKTVGLIHNEETAAATNPMATKSAILGVTPPKSSHGRIQEEIPRASPPSHLGASDIAYLSKATKLRKLFNDYSFAFGDKAHSEGIFSFLQDQILNDVNIDIGVVRKGLQRVAISQPIGSTPIHSAVPDEHSRVPDLEIKNSTQQCQDFSALDLNVFEEMKQLGTTSDSRWVSESRSKARSTTPADLRNISDKPFKCPPKVQPKQSLSSKNLTTLAEPMAKKINIKILPTNLRGRPVSAGCPPNQRFDRTRFQPPKSVKVNIFDGSNSDGALNSENEIHLGKLNSQTIDDLYNFE